MQYLSGWTYRYYRFKNTWDTVAAIWRYKSQQAELGGLIKWAKRKRLKGVLVSYTRRLEETEEKLFILRFRYRFLVGVVAILHLFLTHIKGEPHHYRRGSAAKYRYGINRKN